MSGWLAVASLLLLFYDAFVSLASIVDFKTYNCSSVFGMVGRSSAPIHTLAVDGIENKETGTRHPLVFLLYDDIYQEMLSREREGGIEADLRTATSGWEEVVARRPFPN